MNESKKTLIFCGVALVLAGTAWALYPKTDTALVQSREGSLLFEGFTDPKSVTFLEIQRPAEQIKSLAEVIGKPERLTLTQQPSGNWAVASREDYPAGVMDRVAEAASALADLRIISVESENAAEAGDHERFGVIDPLGSNVDFATTGIGLRITAKGGDKTLADLIVGNAVQGQTDVRYVRRPIQDNVYTAKIKDFSRLTTRFDDWIETRVLDVNSSFDIRRVTIHDDTFALRDRAVQQRYKIDLAYDNEKSKWTPNRILAWDKQAKDYVPNDLKPEEELNTQTLNDLTFGLSDLKIVDVRRKDEEHAKAINRDTGELLISGIGQGEAIEMGPGFFAMRNPNRPVAVLCAGGELQFATKDGMEYWVRFGGEAGLADKRDASAAKDEAKKEEAKKDDAKKEPEKKDGEKKDGDKKDSDKKEDEKKTEDDTKVNRYMFVTVRFNENLIDKPKLQQLPGHLPKDESAKKDEPADNKDKPADKKDTPPAEKSADKPTENKEPAKSPPPAEKKGDPKTEAPKPDDKQSSRGAGSAHVRLANYQADDAKKTEPAKTEPKPAEKPADDKKAPPPADAKPVEAKPDDAKMKAEDEKKKAEDDKKNAEEEQKRIKEANDQKVKEYNETLEKGRKRAKDLNTRFADWFYVISEDSYKKLHLTRDDVVKKKEEKKDDDKKKETPPAIGPGKFNETLGD